MYLELEGGSKNKSDIKFAVFDLLVIELKFTMIKRDNHKAKSLTSSGFRLKMMKVHLQYFDNENFYD